MDQPGRHAVVGLNEAGLRGVDVPAADLRPAGTVDGEVRRWLVGYHLLSTLTTENAQGAARGQRVGDKARAGVTVYRGCRQSLRGGWEAVLDQRQRVLGKIESMQKPSIVTLFGHCLGGGLELPLACHFRLVASEGARIGLPEMELGTIPAWGGTARLTRCIGRDRALDMILRARKIDGEEALRSGLAHSLHPLGELKPAALALARELAGMPPLAVAGVLRCVVAAGEKSLQEALAEERRAFLRCAASADQAEGMQAFLEKRKPLFSGS